MIPRKGVVGTWCDAVNILEMLLAVSEMTRLICKREADRSIYLPAGDPSVS